MTAPEFADVVEAWDTAAGTADRSAAIHPTGVDPVAYLESGAAAAGVIMDLLPSTKYPEVGEFGVGDGRIARHLVDQYDRVVGVDASPVMLQALVDSCPGVDPVLADGVELLADLPQLDGWYTAAVLIHHDFDAGAAILAAIASATRPGGRVLVDIPVYDEARTRATWTDVTVWTAEQLADAAKAAGLRVKETHVNPGAFSFESIGPNHGRFHVLERPRPRKRAASAG